MRRSRWYSAEMNEQYFMRYNTKYSVILSYPTGTVTNYMTWRWDTGGGDPFGGNAGRTADGGNVWISNAPADAMFEIYGQHAIEVLSAKVSTDYLEDGDWLIACHYNNYYPPYCCLSIQPVLTLPDQNPSL